MKLLKLHEGQYAIHAVCNDQGAVPLLDFLENLGANQRSSVNGMYNLLVRCAEFGPPRNADLKHHLGDGIFELIKGRLRVLFFTEKGKLVICTHGFVKKTRKTPKREIDAAKRIRQRYLAASEEKRIQILED